MQMEKDSSGWHSVVDFDRDRRGAFIAVFIDGSGCAIMVSTDSGIVDGSGMEPVLDFDQANFSLYNWLPSKFKTWGMNIADRVTLLEDILRPFAIASEDLDESHGDGSDVWQSPAAMSITAGDLRKARKVILDHPNPTNP